MVNEMEINYSTAKMFIHYNFFYLSPSYEGYLLIMYYFKH